MTLEVPSPAELASSGPQQKPPDTATPPPTGTSSPPPEGAHKTEEYRVLSLTPSIELTNNYPVPYNITATADKDHAYSDNVTFCGSPAMRLSSSIRQCSGDEPSNGRKGIVSGVNQGYASPITSSSIVRINGAYAIRDGDRFYMNQAAPKGPGNTIGEGRLTRDLKPRDPPKIRLAMLGLPGEGMFERMTDAAMDKAKSVASDAASAAGNYLWDKTVGAVSDAVSEKASDVADGAKAAAQPALQWMAEHPRTMGTIQAAGGAVEAVGGGVCAFVTAPTVAGAIWCGAVGLNGVDNFQAGVRTGVSGEFARTGLQYAAGKAAPTLGVSPETGETVAGLASAGIGIGGAPGVASGWSKLNALRKATQGQAGNTAEKVLEAGNPGVRVSAAKIVPKDPRVRKTLDPKWLKPDGDVKWPLNNGAAGPETATTLKPGQIIDRYGSEYGNFASPDGIPYGERALPYDQSVMPYNRYEVLKPIDTNKSVIAPWFDEVGGGTQYRFNNTVGDLVKDGYLKPIK